LSKAESLGQNRHRPTEGGEDRKAQGRRGKLRPPELVVQPLARLSIVLVQLVRIVVPNRRRK
jgi:hypothetical protein